MSRGKSELKQWAREHMKGVENTLFPSFTPDMKDLDEEGIRLDVRQSIRHGFFSMMCATETGLSLDEAKRMVEIAVDEASGEILVTTSLILDSFDDNMELLMHAEKIGADGVLLGYPPTFHPEDKEEVYTVTRRFCDATDLHITLYPSPHFPFGEFHPSGFPLDILERLADLPNVVAIKIGEPGLFADAHRLIGDRVLVGCPVERYVPLLVQGYGMQWMGAGCYEVFQSPEKPYLVDYFNLLLEGKADQAMQIYWKLAPMRIMFEQQFNQTVMTGTYNWHQQKFYQWCVGGNGGLTRQPAMKLHSWEADQIMLGYFLIDITPPDNLQEFFVGKMSYRRLHREGPETVPTPASETARPVQADQPGLSGDPLAQALTLSRGLLADLQQTQTDLKKVPALIRPVARGAFKSKSGQSIEDWLQTAEDLVAVFEGANGGASAAVRGDFPGLAGRLEGLEKYYREAPAENARFVREESEREAMVAEMARREAEVCALIAALKKISD